MSVQFFWYLKYGAVSCTISLAEYVAKLPLKYDNLCNFPEHASGHIFYDETIITELSDIFRPSSFRLYHPVKLEVTSKTSDVASVDSWV